MYLKKKWLFKNQIVEKQSAIKLKKEKIPAHSFRVSPSSPIKIRNKKLLYDYEGYKK